ncbi:MAG: thiol-disulfide oxidoreductase DCC family protein [Puniceicoccaceae bacterium]
MSKAQLIVFYDGNCPFCVGWVKFLLDRDGHDRLRFASLDSAWSTRFFSEHNLKHPGKDSIVVWDGEFIRQRSAAAMAIAEALPGIWQLGRHMDILPRGFRDGTYDWVAQNRYKWFGKYNSCWVPKAGDRRKFLDFEESPSQDAAHGSQPVDNPTPQ